jgi:hypothetical protein
MPTCTTASSRLRALRFKCCCPFCRLPAFLNAGRRFLCARLLRWSCWCWLQAARVRRLHRRRRRDWRTSSKSGTTRLYLEPARPVGLAVAGEDPLSPRDATFEWTDAGVGLQLLDAAAAMSTAPAPAKGRKSAALLLMWQADDVRRLTNDRLGRWASPLVYARHVLQFRHGTKAPDAPSDSRTGVFNHREANT